MAGQKPSKSKKRFLPGISALGRLGKEGFGGLKASLAYKGSANQAELQSEMLSREGGETHLSLVPEGLGNSSSKVLEFIGFFLAPLS